MLRKWCNVFSFLGIMGLAPRMILLTLSLDNFAILKATICLASLSEDHSPSKNASPSRQKEEEEKEKKESLTSPSALSSP